MAAPAYVASDSRTPISEAEGSFEPTQLPEECTFGYWNDRRDLPKRRPMDGAPIISSPLQVCESNLATCVNPWEVECRPNPVIFAHLSDSVEGTSRQNYDANLAALSNSGDAIDTVCPNTNSFVCLPDSHAPPTTDDPGSTLMGLRSIDAESSDDTVPTLESSISEVSADDISSVTTSEESSLFKGQERCFDILEMVELINFTAIIPAAQPSSILDNDIAIVSSMSSHTWTDSRASNSPSQPSPLSSPPSMSVTAKALLSPLASTERSTNTAFPCPLCHLCFRTPGLRRYVILMHKQSSWSC